MVVTFLESNGSGLRIRDGRKWAQNHLSCGSAFDGVLLHGDASSRDAGGHGDDQGGCAQCDREIFCRSVHLRGHGGLDWCARQVQLDLRLWSVLQGRLLRLLTAEGHMSLRTSAADDPDRGRRRIVGRAVAKRGQSVDRLRTTRGKGWFSLQRLHVVTSSSASSEHHPSTGELLLRPHFAQRRARPRTEFLCLLSGDVSVDATPARSVRSEE